MEALQGPANEGDLQTGKVVLSFLGELAPVVHLKLISEHLPLVSGIFILEFSAS